MPTQHSLIALVALCLVASACGKKAGEPALPTAEAPAAKVALDGDDPCRLVSTAEAEALLGAPLAVAPYRSYVGIGDSAGKPLETSDGCWYEASNRHNFSITLSRANGGAILKGVAGVSDVVEKNAKLKLQDGTELAGEWDEAKLLHETNLLALRGDTLVDVDTGGTEATPQEVASLADAAIKRLEAPLPYDSAAGFAKAEAFYRARADRGDPCSLLTKADIEAVLGGSVKGEPMANSSGDECSYRYATQRGGLQTKQDQGTIPKGTMSEEEMKMLSGFMGALGASAAIGDDVGGGSTQELLLRVKWRNGYRHYRVENQMFGSMAKGFGREIGGEAGAAALGGAQEVAGPWEKAQSSEVQFNSVKRDVQIAIKPTVLKPAQYAELLTRAYATAP